MYDILVILVLAHNVFCCYKNGFFRSLVSIISYVVGFVISHLMGKSLLKNVFKSSVFSIIEDSISQTSCNTPIGVALNSFIENSFGGSLAKLFTTRVVFVLLFFTISAFFRAFKNYIFKLARAIKNMPVLGALDGILGGVCGVLKAFLFLIFFAVICFILITLTQDSWKLLNSKVINSTYLFFLFYKIINFTK